MKMAKIMLLLACVAVFNSGNVNARALDSDCEPSGLMAKGREILNPKAFWRSQVIEINEYIEISKASYRASMFEWKREKLIDALDDEEADFMGGYSPDSEFDRDMAELDKEMAKTDQYLLDLDRRMFNMEIEWGSKCSEYVKQKLSQLKK